MADKYSLKEIKEYYTLEEIADINEIIAIEYENERRSINASKNKQEQLR